MYALVVLLSLVGLSHQHAGHAHSSIPSAQINSALSTLCSENGTNPSFSVGCTLLSDCTRQINASPDGMLTASSVAATATPSARNASECKTEVLYTATCNDPASAGNPACNAFATLCVTGNGTDPLCDGMDMLPLEEYNLTTYKAWDTLQGLCAYHAKHLGRIYNHTTGVSVIDPASRRRHLLHGSESHDNKNMSTTMALNNTGVPHTESAHEYCAACLKTSTNTSTLPRDCPDGPLLSIAGLCTIKPMGTGNMGFDKLCAPFKMLCAEHGDAFEGLCGALAA